MHEFKILSCFCAVYFILVEIKLYLVIFGSLNTEWLYLCCVEMVATISVKRWILNSLETLVVSVRSNCKQK